METSTEQERGRAKTRGVMGGAGRSKARKGRLDDDEEEEVIEIEAFADVDVIQDRSAVVGRTGKRIAAGAQRETVGYLVALRVVNELLSDVCAGGRR